MESQLRCLCLNGFKEIGIAISPQDEKQITSYFGNGKEFGLNIHYVVDEILKGPAGSLELFDKFIGDDSFVVIHGNTYIDLVDLGDLVKFHNDREAMVTLGIYQDSSMPEYLESIATSHDGRIQRLEILHPSKDKRRHNRFGGVYLFDSKVLEFIQSNGYVDIKEQLLPELHKAGHRIFGHPLQGFHACIRSIEEYYKIQQDILQTGMFDGSGYVQVSDAVWIGEGTRISPSSYILGPVIVGTHCIIEDNANIIGPAVIGDHSRIAEKSLIRESILWNRTEISKRSRVEYSIVGHECSVPADKGLRESVLMGTISPVKYSLLGISQKSIEKITPLPDFSHRLKEIGSKACKRVLDMVIAMVGLVASIPLFLIIAMAIKLDSNGPVFYIQKRCGKGGKEFKMIKFRTMVTDAERLQKGLQEKKDVDGPVFKMFNDPRVTKVGKFLRQYSLDELPQLYNVLKGEMSLVGPRPLIMGEMRFSPSWRDFRLSIKPGITGLWQINGRGHVSFHNWIRYDVSYVKNQSLWLDLKILMKTVLWVVKRVGAY